jgi:hypothetical protein
MRLAHGSQLATTAAYATYLFHDARILQPTKRWRSSPTKKAGRVRPAFLTEALLKRFRGYSRLSASRYSSVSSEVSAAAMYVKAAAESTRFVPSASPRERMP